MTDPPFRQRRFVPVPSGSRPVRSRRAVRVIVTDGHRVLLFTDTDPGVPGSRWWVTPGGGMDPGETPGQTAVRELAEETGLRVSQDRLLGPVMSRFVVHGYSDQVLGQAELFYLLRVDAPFVPDTAGFTELELLTLTEWDWLVLDELDAADRPVWPADLPRLVALAARPEDWPEDQGVVEESVVPAGELGRLAARSRPDVAGVDLP